MENFHQGNIESAKKLWTLEELGITIQLSTMQSSKLRNNIIE